ncbi:MAG: hypothetical protein WCG76_00070 [Verrucomicrobiota bacterium]
MPTGVHRRKPERFLLPKVPLVRVVGRILGVDVEECENPDEIDHVWIRIHAGADLIVSINTSSKKNRLAGFDPRIRVGLNRGTCAKLPLQGVEICPSNDYADIEARANVYFEHYERGSLEDLLKDRCARACLLEAWGAPYQRIQQGVHQIHSRRASCAVPEDIRGRDGALKFYYESGQATELFLFKFCGQP